MTPPETDSAPVKAGFVKRFSPGVVLFLLAPVLAELLSGHQSPVEFFNPLSLILLSLPYGCGALICRELVVRWHKGRFSLLLLGMAYGMYEEGIVVRSIFNPDWGELGSLAEYSHIAGVTWTYAELLIHFHAIVSITAGVMLVEMLYPERSRQPWISNRVFAGCVIGILLWIPAGLWMTSYFPPVELYILAWVSIAALVGAARYVPANPLKPRVVTVPRPRWFWLLGALNMSAVFFLVFLTPQFNAPPFFVTAPLVVMVDGAVIWLVLHWSGNGAAWDDRHRLALIAGELSFFIYACFDHDIEKWEGLSIVGVMAIIALWQLKRRVGYRISQKGVRADG